MLFSIINESKNLACYEISNIAFAVLIDIALDSSAKKYKFIWESNENSPSQWENFDSLDTYYDLLTISSGLRSACIPVPLLRKSSAKALMSLCEPADKHESNRSLASDQWEKADKLIAKLWEKLIENYPQALNLAHKYLGCSFCKYFAGQGKPINCSPHPEGLKGAETCKDFEFKLDLEKLAQEVKKHLSYDRINQQLIEESRKEDERERLLSLKKTANLEIPEISQKVELVKEQISVIQSINPSTFQTHNNFADCKHHWIGLSKKGSYYTPDERYSYCDLWQRYPSVAEVSGYSIHGIVTTCKRRVKSPAKWSVRYEVSLPSDLSLSVLFTDENKDLNDEYYVGEMNPALRGVANQFVDKLIEAKEAKLKSLNLYLKNLQDKLKYWQDIKQLTELGN